MVRAMYIMGRITTWPFLTTGLSKTPCMPRMADWGGLMMGVPNKEPNTPPLLMVKVPPSMSSIGNLVVLRFLAQLSNPLLNIRIVHSLNVSQHWHHQARRNDPLGDGHSSPGELAGEVESCPNGRPHCVLQLLVREEGDEKVHLVGEDRHQALRDPCPHLEQVRKAVTWTTSW